MNSLIADLIGYISMVFLLAGIVIVRKKDWSLYSDICIVFGDSGLVINCLYYDAIPAFLVNLIIIIITFFNIRKDLKGKKK